MLRIPYDTDAFPAGTVANGHEAKSAGDLLFRERVLATRLRGRAPWKDSVYLVSFTCLKAFAFDQRFEPRDAHDLVYCTEHAPKGPVAVAKFELGEGDEADQREARVLRQRQASDVIDRLLAGIG
jgi:hypothetical protein